MSRLVDCTPPPARPALAAMPLHLLVRDYPETLAVLRRFGVDVARRGGSPVTEAVDGDVGPLIDAVIAATSWREAA